MEKMLYSLKKYCFALCLFLIANLINSTSFAQVDSLGINYQAIARDTSANALVNTTIKVKFSVFNSLSGGTAEYSEEHTSVQTNKYGLFTLVIGYGTPIVGVYNAISWQNSNKFLEVEIDLPPNGYTKIGERTRFQAVPYAYGAVVAATAATAITSIDGWKTGGNNLSANPGGFLGTTSGDDLVIKTNNNNSMVIDDLTGNVEISRGNLSITKSAPSVMEIEFLDSINQADIMANHNLNIGTKKANPFIIKTKNQSRVLIDTLGNVKIGNSITPQAKLDVAGTLMADTVLIDSILQITSGNPGTGRVLTSDANGFASWQNNSGLGTVTKVTADSLLPLFTTKVNDSSTTPHIDFTLANASAYTVFGNNTSGSATPNYFAPQLASPLFQNQGSTTQVLHGNGAGNPSWGQIVNADIATGTIDLTTKVTGKLPIINGGTNVITIGLPGSVAYSNGTAYNFTAVGVAGAGQVLESTGSGAPIWSKRVRTITGTAPVVATTSDSVNYAISVAANSQSSAGVVPAGGTNSNMVWKTDAAGNPAWRADSSGTSYIMGTGLSTAGDTINSVWTESGNNIYANIPGNVGIGISNPSIAKLYVVDSSTTKIVGYFESNGSTSALVGANKTNGIAIEAVIDKAANLSDALLAQTAGSGNAIHAINTGNGRAGTFEITNGSTADAAVYVSSNGTGRGASFILNNTTNSTEAILATTNGTGRVAFFSNSNSVNSSNAVDITTNGNNSNALKVTNTGASGTKTGARFESIGGGTTNRAGYFSATGATNNYAAIFDQGNVGIGTSAPSEKLTIAYTGGGTDPLKIYNTTGTSTTFHITKDHRMLFSPNTNAASGTLVEMGQGFGTISSGATFMKINPLGVDPGGILLNVLEGITSRLVVDGNGNVGIGTSAPSQKLVVENGNLFLSNSNNTASKLVFAEPSGSGVNTTSFEAQAQGANVSYILPAAQATAPALLLNNGLGTLSWATQTQLNIWSKLGDAGTTPPSVPIGTAIPSTENYIGTTDVKDFVLATNSRERMRISNSGNVGIGTVSPTLPLHVVGNSLFESSSGANLRVGNSAQTNYAEFQSNNSSLEFVGSPWSINRFSSSSLSINAGGGNVNIGDLAFSPANLQVTDGTPSNTEQTITRFLRMRTDATAPSSSMTGVVNFSAEGFTDNQFGSVATIKFGWENNQTNDNTDRDGYLTFNTVLDNTSPAERLRITAAGNVGIGTSTPSAQLHTTGGVKFDTLAGVGSRLVVADASGNISAGSSSTGLITGSGIADYIPRYTPNGTTLGNSVIYQAVGGNIGIGTTNPNNKLDVEGGVAIGTNFSGTQPAPANGVAIEGKVGIGIHNPQNELDIEGRLAVGSAYSGSLTAPTNGAIIEGRVGIGTHDPQSKLGVVGGVAIGTNYGSGSQAAPTSGAIIEGSVGIGVNIPVNKLDVEGGLAIGAAYSGDSLAPANGAIIQGKVGIGTASLTTAKLTVVDSNSLVAVLALNKSSGDALRAVNTGSGPGAYVVTTSTINTSNTFFTETYGTGNTIRSRHQGTSGRAGLFEINNINNASDVIQATTSGAGSSIRATNSGSVAGRAGTFEVTNSANTADAVYITTNGTNSAAIKAINTGTGTTNTAGYFSATGATNNYAAIFENGNVGIGITTPVAGLQIEDKNFEIRGLTGTQRRILLTGDTNNPYIELFNAGSTNTKINTAGDSYFNGGNVGIGTATPGTSLEINGAITYTPKSRSIGTNNILTPGNEGYIRISASSGTPSIIGFSGAGASIGQIVIIQNVDISGGITVASGTGSKLNMGVPYVMGSNDTLTLIFDGNNWVEISRSNN